MKIYQSDENKPWYDSEYNNIKHEVKPILRRCKRYSHLPKYHNAYLELEIKYKKTLKDKRMQYNDGLVLSFSYCTNPIRFWKKVKT